MVLLWDEMHDQTSWNIHWYDCNLYTKMLSWNDEKSSIKLTPTGPPLKKILKGPSSNIQDVCTVKFDTFVFHYLSLDIFQSNFVSTLKNTDKKWFYCTCSLSCLSQSFQVIWVSSLYFSFLIWSKLWQVMVLIWAAAWPWVRLGHQKALQSASRELSSFKWLGCSQVII